MGKTKRANMSTKVASVGKVPRAPKTPKSSATKIKEPKTPKSSVTKKANKKLEKREKIANGEIVQKKKKKKKNTATTDGEDIALTQEVAPPVEHDTAEQDEQPKKKKKKSNTKVPSVTLQISTPIDNLDPKCIKGQWTRSRDMAKEELKLQQDISENGIVDLSFVPGFDGFDMTPEQAAHIAAKVPISSMRLSRDAVQLNQWNGCEAYTSKMRDVFNLNKSLAGKQTVTLDMVWAERDYRSTTNMSAAMVLRENALPLEESMIEDIHGAYPGSTDDAIPLKAWKHAERAYKVLSNGTDPEKLKRTVTDLYAETKFV